jgi:glucan-binding YG repeat protein
MKKCTECGILKPLDNFHKDLKKLDGLRSRCKKCVCKKQNLYRIKNPDKNKEYYKNNIEKSKAYSREYYKKNHKKSERILLTDYEKKLQKKEYDKKYHIKYPEKRKAKIAVNLMKVEHGYHKHHWSYNKDHYKDVIILTNKQHLSLHKFLKYCSESFYYKTLDGKLLDSRQTHLNYIHELLNLNKL